MTVVYLLCYERPLAHAQHYLGFAEDDDPTERLERHRSGNGARLPAAFARNGIEFRLARSWVGATRKDERYLKDLHSTKNRLCPICCGRVRRVRYLEREEITETIHDHD